MGAPVPKDCNCNFYICPVVVYNERNSLGASLTPPKRVTRFPRLEEGNVPIIPHSLGCFGISRVWGKSLTARGYPSADSDQSEKLIEFRERIRSRIHKKTAAKYKRMHDELRHSLTQFFITDFGLTRSYLTVIAVGRQHHDSSLSEIIQLSNHAYILSI
ncbi:hypothetical protein TNCV_1001841 [Trichonephila clavipes]|nr:hypothetical protein TNCV_1001841 [Trichonephila clavipes]